MWIAEFTSGSVVSAHFAAFDGNGNVSASLSARDGTETRYEYGPFGETIRQTGTFATNNPFRFSAKFTDNESGMLYYGYRYYNPSTGRWLSRDPIGERGGLNRYGFVRNCPISRFDPFGLEEQGPQNFKAICDMAKRLRGEIDKLPQTSLKRPFLETQECILNRLCNSHCCLNSSSANWLNNTVRDFMNPLFDALGGRGNQRWKDTFDQLDKWQKEIENTTRPVGGDTAPLIIGEAINEEMTTLLAARKMALTHINQDLRKSPVNNGAGLDTDWKCVGNQVSECEKKFFYWFERWPGKGIGLFDDTFDVSKFRDRMRREVQNPIPPEPPVWDGVWPPYGIN